VIGRFRPSAPLSKTRGSDDGLDIRLEVEAERHARVWFPGASGTWDAMNVCSAGRRPASRMPSENAVDESRGGRRDDEVLDAVQGVIRGELSAGDETQMRRVRPPGFV
jgi:hypothetical protein